RPKRLRKLVHKRTQVCVSCIETASRCRGVKSGVMSTQHIWCVARLAAPLLLLLQTLQAHAMEPGAPETAVQAQVGAYNAHDIRAFNATYAKRSRNLRIPG